MSAATDDSSSCEVACRLALCYPASIDWAPRTALDAKSPLDWLSWAGLRERSARATTLCGPNDYWDSRLRPAPPSLPSPPCLEVRRQIKTETEFQLCAAFSRKRQCQSLTVIERESLLGSSCRAQASFPGGTCRSVGRHV